MREAIEAEVLTIGRNADISLPDNEESISRVHCELIITDGGFYLTDAHSQNGTFIEEDGSLKQIHQAWVTFEQTIVLGECRTSLAELLGDRIHSQAPKSDVADPVSRPAREKKPSAKSYRHVTGRRVRCPNGHIVLSTLPGCPRCGETLH